MACLISIKHTRRINHCRTGIQGNGNTQGTGNFFARAARFDCRFHMHGNTAIATRRDGNGERNQFARFQIERAIFPRLA